MSLYHGDSMRVLDALAPESIDSVVTDPPYNLMEMTRRFGKPGAAPAKHGTDGRYTRLGRGFMGQAWDGTGITFDPTFWAKVLRVLKPGAFCLAMGGTRTYHRMVCALEDAGFSVKDCICWLYATGFPKSHNVAKAMNHKVSDEAQAWSGYGTALKPAVELIVLAQKPISEQTIAANVQRWGVGVLNIDGCRIEGRAAQTRFDPSRHHHAGYRMSDTGAETAARAHQTAGRWPANVLLDDGSAAEMDDQTIGAYGDSGARPSRYFYVTKPDRDERDAGLLGRDPTQRGCVFGNDGPCPHTDSDHYYAASVRNTHPTVKPLSLLRYLCRLVTPPGGMVLDPFIGSGTTAIAAVLEGLQCTGIDQSADYLDIAERRITWWAEHRTDEAHQSRATFVGRLL